MKAELRYRIALVLFGLVISCAAMSASLWLMDGLVPFWAICCQILSMSTGHPIYAWRSIVWPFVAGAFLFFGLGVLGHKLWKMHKFSAEIKTASISDVPKRLKEIVAQLNISESVVLLPTEIPVAFCFGLLWPRICISTGLADILTNKELKAVLLHEDRHRRFRDPLQGLFADVLAKTFFFLPVAAELRDLFITSIELAADRYAVHFTGRPALAGALHKIISHPSAYQPLEAGVASINPLNATQVRIAELLDDRPATLRLSTQSLIKSSLIMLLGCLLVL